MHAHETRASLTLRCLFTIECRQASKCECGLASSGLREAAYRHILLRCILRRRLCLCDEQDEEDQTAWREQEGAGNASNEGGESLASFLPHRTNSPCRPLAWCGSQASQASGRATSQLQAGCCIISLQQLILCIGHLIPALGGGPAQGWRTALYNRCLSSDVD